MLFNITSGAFCSPQAGEAQAVAPIEGTTAWACRLGPLLPKQQATMRHARRQARPKPCPQPCGSRLRGHFAAPAPACPNKRTARACRVSANLGKLPPCGMHGGRLARSHALNPAAVGCGGTLLPPPPPAQTSAPPEPAERPQTIGFEKVSPCGVSVGCAPAGHSRFEKAKNVQKGFAHFSPFQIVNVLNPCQKVHLGYTTLQTELCKTAFFTYHDFCSHFLTKRTY